MFVTFAIISNGLGQNDTGDMLQHLHQLFWCHSIAQSPVSHKHPSVSRIPFCATVRIFWGLLVRYSVLLEVLSCSTNKVKLTWNEVWQHLHVPCPFLPRFEELDTIQRWREWERDRLLARSSVSQSRYIAVTDAKPSRTCLDVLCTGVEDSCPAVYSGGLRA